MTHRLRAVNPRDDRCAADVHLSDSGPPDRLVERNDMSESYGSGAGTPGSANSPSSSGPVRTATHEAGEIADTAAGHAGDVVGTASSEARGVAAEAKSQAKDLFAQTQRELKEQAGVQQQRVAEGLRSIGDELQSMSGASDSPGVASDLVRQVSTRVSDAACWLADRDPASLLTEVKAYARRQPGVFIAVAALAGLAAGRLTRALTEGAKESSDSTEPVAAAADVPPPVTSAVTPSATEGLGASDVGAPVYDQTRAAYAEGRTVEGSGDVRSDPL